jgi:prepilin-type processing-associated H-X9-DG protein
VTGSRGEAPAPTGDGYTPETGDQVILRATVIGINKHYTWANVGFADGSGGSVDWSVLNPVGPNARLVVVDHTDEQQVERIAQGIAASTRLPWPVAASYWRNYAAAALRALAGDAS